MKSIIIILQLALLIFLLLLLRFFLQRVRLLVSLKWFARKYGFQVRGFRPIFFLPLNGTKKNMITLETDNYIYDIKPFGLLRKNYELHFWGLSEYSMEWYFSRHGLDHKPHLFIGTTNERKRRRIGAFVTSLDATPGKEHTPYRQSDPEPSDPRSFHRTENGREHPHASRYERKDEGLTGYILPPPAWISIFPVGAPGHRDRPHNAEFPA